jgi:hypothetical protein
MRLSEFEYSYLDPGVNSQGLVADQAEQELGRDRCLGVRPRLRLPRGALGVVRNPARVLEELAQRDRGPRGGLIQQDLPDRAVGRQAPVVDELERDGAAERLRGTGGPQVIVALDRSAAFDVAHTRPQDRSSLSRRFPAWASAAPVAIARSTSKPAPSTPARRRAGKSRVRTNPFSPRAKSPPWVAFLGRHRTAPAQEAVPWNQRSAPFDALAAAGVRWTRSAPRREGPWPKAH